MLTDTSSLDLAPYAVGLQALAAAVAAGPTPLLIQRQVAEQAQTLIEDIAVNAGPLMPGVTGSWAGTRGVNGLRIFGQTTMVIASLTAEGEAKWVSISDESGATWQIDFAAAFRASDMGGWKDFLGGGDPVATAEPVGGTAPPVLMVSISQSSEVLSKHRFEADGSTTDEQDWAGRFDAATEAFSDKLGGMAESDEEEGEVLPVGNDVAGVELGGAVGRRVLRGAVAGLAGLAAAKVAQAAVSAKDASVSEDRDEAEPEVQKPSPPPIVPMEEDRGVHDLREVSEPGRWFYINEGQQKGPVNRTGLEDLVARGSLMTSSRVWSEKDPKWVAISDLPELEAVAPPTEPIDVAKVMQAHVVAQGTAPEEAALEVIDPSGEPRRTVIGSRLLVGRDRRCDLVLDDNVVSGGHAVIKAVGGTFVIKDKDSTNGTFVNDQRIEGLTELHHGDELRMGGCRFRFVSPAEQPPDSTVVVPLSEITADEPVGLAPEAESEPVDAPPRRCAACDRELSGRARYCVTCGTESGLNLAPLLDAVRDEPATDERSCGRCGAELGAEQMFCTRCGESVEEDPGPQAKFCGRCGGTLDPTDRFCGSCGHRAVT